MSLKETNLYREIHAQPAALSLLLASEKENIQVLAQEIKKRNISYVVIAARGTSDNAGRYAQYVLGAHNGLMVALATPSLFSIYGQPPQLGNALVIGISQSGKSPDIVSVVAEARKQGALTAVLTNETASDLAAQGDFVIGLHAGTELAVAATKTYTTELTAIAMLSVALSEDRKLQEELGEIVTAVDSTLTMFNPIAAVVQRYRYMEQSVIIGRGFNYATAFEMALKMKELTYTIVEPYSSADFEHGPMALIEPGFPVIVIAPQGKMLHKLTGFIQKLRDREAEVIAISDSAQTLALARIPLALPRSVPEWLSPITTIVPGQMFAMLLAHARDYDIDAPRGLNKVTETH
ncbi:MAG: SIS domain-containing protein [Anaerolineales bacterium]|nr:SIS domain-containing protein [Anaerolineales bacterium]